MEKGSANHFKKNEQHVKFVVDVPHFLTMMYS